MSIILQIRVIDTKNSNTDIFEVVGQSVERKYFVENFEHAGKWGDTLYGQGSYRVVEVEVPTSVADQFYRWDNLDNIGPARFAHIDQLRDPDIIIRGVQ